MFFSYILCNCWPLCWPIIFKHIGDICTRFYNIFHLKHHNSYDKIGQTRHAESRPTEYIDQTLHIAPVIAGNVEPTKSRNQLRGWKPSLYVIRTWSEHQKHFIFTIQSIVLIFSNIWAKVKMPILKKTKQNKTDGPTMKKQKMSKPCCLDKNNQFLLRCFNYLCIQRSFIVKYKYINSEHKNFNRFFWKIDVLSNNVSMKKSNRKD